jgi:hypothetical protein
MIYYVKNITDTDLDYRKNGYRFIIKKNGYTKLDDQYVTFGELKRTFLRSVKEIPLPSEAIKDSAHDSSEGIDITLNGFENTLSNASKETFQASEGYDVVPSDVDDLPKGDALLYVGTGGDLKIDFQKGGTVTFKNLQDGMFLPARVKKVYATGTDAADLIRLH